MKAKGDIKEKFWNSKDICKISIPYLKWLLLSWKWRLTEDGEFRLNWVSCSFCYWLTGRPGKYHSTWRQLQKEPRASCCLVAYRFTWAVLLHSQQLPTNQVSCTSVHWIDKRYRWVPCKLPSPYEQVTNE